MIKYIIATMMALVLMGCGSDSEAVKNAQAKLVVGQNLNDFKVKDQNEKPQTISNDTKIVFFSFSKKVGHICNEFLGENDVDFLQKHNAVYVADVSPAPSIIKNMFILPDLKELKFPILLINDDILSAEYSKDMDKESVVVVFVDNKKITDIKNLKSKDELVQLFK